MVRGQGTTALLSHASHASIPSVAWSATNYWSDLMMPLEKLLQRKDIPADAKDVIKKSSQKLRQLAGELQEAKRLLQCSTNDKSRATASSGLLEDEHFFKTIIANTYDLMSLTDLNGNVLWTNPAWHKVLGYAKNIIKNPFTIIHPNDRPRLVKAWQLFTTRGDVEIVTYRIQTATGEYIVLETMAKIIDMAGKKIVLGIARDITERKQAEEKLEEVKMQEERYHTMLGHFLKNNLHEIVNDLEYFLLEYEASHQCNTKLITNVITTSFHAAKTIDTVNTIFRVLQSSFERSQQPINVLGMVQQVLSDFRVKFSFPWSVTITEEVLDREILADAYFKEAVSEVLSYIFSFTSEQVVIEGSQLASTYCITIKDFHSRPIPQEVCVRLMETITDKWEAQGHYIGLSLASVIMQHYGGYLGISPSGSQGNTFQLFFPSSLLPFRAHRELG